MPLYENVFIARQDISGAQVDALADGFTQLIAEQGGEIKKREYWGLRNLAYRMKKNRKGHYVLFNIEAPAAAIAELERTMRINEDVLRYLTLRVDQLDEAPSPVMLPAPQILPVLRTQRAEDRLQGRPAVAALHLRARQDRAEPHHRGVDAKAARAGAGDQAGAVSRPAPLYRELEGKRGRTTLP